MVFMAAFSSGLLGDIFIESLRFSSMGIAAGLDSVMPKVSRIDSI